MSEQKRKVGKPFEKGTSGNPGGMSAEVAETLRLARDASPEAIKKLIEIMRDGRSDAIRMEAATRILDRGCGKPTQTIAGDKDNPLHVEDPSGARAFLAALTARLADEAKP